MTTINHVQVNENKKIEIKMSEAFEKAPKTHCHLKLTSAKVRVVSEFSGQMTRHSALSAVHCITWKYQISYANNSTSGSRLNCNSNFPSDRVN
jgi:hypothetical protein